MRLRLFVLFITAFASQTALIFAYWVVGMNPNDRLTWPLLMLTSICVVVMAALAIVNQNADTRWLSVGLIGVVILTFSALTIISLGLLMTPIALALIVASIVVLMWNRRSPSTDG